MKEITSEDLRWNLTRVGAEAARGVRWKVLFHGKPRFAIVPIEDLELIQAKSPKKPAKKKPAK